MYTYLVNVNDELTIKKMIMLLVEIMVIKTKGWKQRWMEGDSLTCRDILPEPELRLSAGVIFLSCLHVFIHLENSKHIYST